MSTTGGNTGSRIYFDDPSSLTLVTSISFKFDSNGWYGSGGLSLFPDEATQKYVTSLMLERVEDYPAVILPSQFNSYFGNKETIAIDQSRTVVAVNDVFTMIDAQSKEIDLLKNDAQLSGYSLTITLTSQPSNGTLTEVSLGKYVYTPDSNYFGTDGFSYVISDGANSETASATINVKTSGSQDSSYTITRMSTTGGNTGSRIYFDDPSSLTLVTSISFKFDSNGWYGSGGLSLFPDEATQKYVTSLMLERVEDYPAVILPSQFNSYFGNKETIAIDQSRTVVAVNDVFTMIDAQSKEIDLLKNDAQLSGYSLTITLTSQPSNGTLTEVSLGKYVYTPDSNYFGTDGFSYVISDGANSETASATINVKTSAPANEESVLSELITIPSDSNDVISLDIGGNTINGYDGLDQVVYGDNYEGVTVTKTSSGWEISSEAGTDTLEGVERLEFADKKLALDIDGNAGAVAKLLGAFLGAEGVQFTEYVTIGLEALDSGTSFEGLLQLALDTVFGSDPSGTELVSTFYQNLTGQTAPQDIIDTYATLIDSGSLTPLELAAQVAEHPLNAESIDLIGLATIGIEYA